MQTLIESRISALENFIKTSYPTLKLIVDSGDEKIKIIGYLTSHIGFYLNPCTQEIIAISDKLANLNQFTFSSQVDPISMVPGMICTITFPKDALDDILKELEVDEKSVLTAAIS